MPNIKNCFRRLLIATMTPHPSKRLAFCWTLSLTLRVLLKMLWTPHLSRSSDSDRKRCQVGDGADAQLFPNRHRYSV